MENFREELKRVFEFKKFVNERFNQWRVAQNLKPLTAILVSEIDREGYLFIKTKPRKGAYSKHRVHVSVFTTPDEDFRIFIYDLSYRNGVIKS